MSRRGVVLAVPLLTNALPSCAGTILARGRSAEGGRLSAREVSVLEARDPPYLGRIVTLAWSADGGRIASVGFADGPYPQSNDVMLWDVAAGRRIAAVPRARSSHFALAFTPDSRFLVMPAARAPGSPAAPPPGPDHLSLVDARTGAVVGAVPSGLPPPPPGGTPDDLAVAPAGGRVAAVFAGGPRGMVAVVYDAPTGGGPWRPAASFALPWLDARGLAFSPDGRRLAATGGKGGDQRPLDPIDAIGLMVAVRDAKDGSAIWSERVGVGSAHTLAWGGADGSTIALGMAYGNIVGGHGTRVVALDAGTGALRWAAVWQPASVEGLAFSPDGRLLAAASYGDEVRVLDAATGAELLSIGGLREPRAVAWGPARPRLLLAFNDGPRIRIAGIERGG